MDKHFKYWENKTLIRHRVILLFALVLCLVLVIPINAQNSSASTNPASCKKIEDPKPSPFVTLYNAEIVAISTDSTDKSFLYLQCQGQTPEQQTLNVKSPELKDSLKQFSPGDRVVIEYNKTPPMELTSLSVKTQTVDVLARILALILSWIILLFLSRLSIGRRWGDLIVGVDGRYSNSKTQLVAWFFLIIGVYLSLTLLRGFNGGLKFVGGIAIPQNLLLLSGLSALTFVGAKGITQSKVDENPQIKTDNPNQPRLFFDLSHDDEGRVDVGDFQMIIITVLAVGVYFVQIFGFLGTIELHKLVTLPDVDTTILSSFGLGQGAYLVKKFIGDKGGGKTEAETPKESTSSPQPIEPNS